MENYNFFRIFRPHIYKNTILTARNLDRMFLTFFIIDLVNSAQPIWK